jgi:hypothetical protein
LSVVVVCFDSDVDKRKLLLAIRDKGMDTKDYVYIFPQTQVKATGE